jgi:nitric oxide reductase large subunit
MALTAFAAGLAPPDPAVRAMKSPIRIAPVLMLISTLSLSFVARWTPCLTIRDGLAEIEPASFFDDDDIVQLQVFVRSVGDVVLGIGFLAVIVESSFIGG